MGTLVKSRYKVSALRSMECFFFSIPSISPFNSFDGIKFIDGNEEKNIVIVMSGDKSLSCCESNVLFLRASN